MALALKGFNLYRKGGLTNELLLPLSEHVERALREAIHSCEGGGGSDPIPLCDRLRELHDVLLDTLRPLFAEGFVNPKMSLRLTNTFIHFGSERFVQSLLSDPRNEEERESIARCLRILLSARGVEVEEKERPEGGKAAETGAVTVEGKRYVTAEKARGAIRAALRQRHLGWFLCDPHRRSTFQVRVLTLGNAAPCGD